jgi:site-specific DNA recombinase
MAVALYARVSTPRQAENDLSIPDQLRQLREYCKARSFAIACEYVEPGATATDDRRAVFQQMIADATQPPAPFDAILVHSRSRFFRDLFEFLQYERILKKVGVKIVSITQETSDDAAGEMASKLFSLFDEYQSKENAKHTQRAMQENARQGYWNGSVPPFGYRAMATDTVGNRGRRKRRLELDPLEAESVREIYRLYLHGRDGNVLGMKAIAAHLNGQGLTMRGHRWRIQKVNRLLSDPLYSGCFYFNRRDSRTRKERPQPEWIAVTVPAIIDAGTFERVAKRRASCSPMAVPPRVVSSPAPLVGLLKCGHCGAGMAQASGKSGRYRYYKCTTRLAKSVDACTAKNLPREQTDAMVLDALSERVFTPKRVSLMLTELLRHQQQAKTAEDARLITLTKELERATTGLDRLYQAIEEGAVSIDETLRTRTQKLKARRCEILTDMAKLKDRQALAVRRVNADTVNAFCTALKERFTDRTSGLGKAYLRLLVDEIKLDGNELTVRGSHRRLADAIGFMQKRKLGEVPSFVNDWRARQDLNPRPPGS